MGSLHKFETRQVFEQNYEWFKRFLRSRFFDLNDYDIEDLIQQAALNLLLRGDSIAGIKNLTSYVYASLENGAKDFFRKRKKETLASEEREESTDVPEDAVLILELKQVILKSIEKLEEKQRYVFIETEIKGRSYEELVRETGEKLGTLLSRKNRAIKKLRYTLRQYIMKEEI